jgi:hypothetical protein
MSDSVEIELTFSVLSCQAEQFTSDSAEILIFTQSNSAENRPTFRQVCSADQGQLFSLVEFTLKVSMIKICYLPSRVNVDMLNNITMASSGSLQPTCPHPSQSRA